MNTIEQAPAVQPGTRAVDAAAPPVRPGMVERCRELAAHPGFQNLVLAVIVLNAATIGMETSATLNAWFGTWFTLISGLAQLFFVVEIAIRLTACWPRPLRFFRDGWNTFDFLVVAVAFVPATGGLTTLGRLARVGRATRLVSALPELRLVFETLLRSIPSISHILLLLTLFLYVYGIVGFRLYAATDPAHWGSLGAAIFTLFQVLTLEGWPEIQRSLGAAHPWSWVFFTSFIVIVVWVVTSLFVAVIVHNLELARQSEAERFDLEVPGSPLGHIADIREALTRLERDIRRVGEEVRDPHRDPNA